MENQEEQARSNKTPARITRRSGTEIWWASWLAIYWEILGSQTLDRKLTLSYSWWPPDSQRATFRWKFTHHGLQRTSSHLCSTTKKQSDQPATRTVGQSPEMRKRLTSLFGLHRWQSQQCFPFLLQIWTNLKKWDFVSLLSIQILLVVCKHTRISVQEVGFQPQPPCTGQPCLHCLPPLAVWRLRLSSDLLY